MRNTHMPFLYPDGMLYAAAPEAVAGTPARWKIHIEQRDGFTADFEAREIRFVPEDGWTLEPLETAAWGLGHGTLRTASTEGAVAQAPSLKPHAGGSDTRIRRELRLRANCATGKFCAICRNHRDTRVGWLGTFPRRRWPRSADCRRPASGSRLQEPPTPTKRVVVPGAWSRKTDAKRYGANGS